MGLLLGSVVLAAVIGAVLSNVTTIVAQRLERSARQRELLFSAAIDLSKTWIGRIAGASDKNRAVSEVMAVELTYEMLNEIFKHGKLSEQNRAHLLRDLDQIEKGYEKKPSDSPSRGL